MRISSLQIFRQGVEAFSNQQEKLSILQQQISTGVRITKPSDDPAAMSRVLELDQTLDLYERYNVNITLAENRLNIEETTLDAVENIYFRINELSIQANSIANDSVALGSIATEIEERYKELLDLANTKDTSGDYLFSGFQNQAEPFSSTVTGDISHVVFNGDQGSRAFQISETRQLVADDPGSKLFMQIPSTMGLNESASAANTGTAVMAPAFVNNVNSYTPGTYEIQFTSATTYDVVDTSGPTTLVTGAPYTDSGVIEFNGIRTSMTGVPANGDVFTVSQGQYRDIFTTINSITDSLRGSVLSDNDRTDNLLQAQTDMEAFFNNVLEVRTSIGGRLNALESQRNDNEAYMLSIQSTISSLRDTDLAAAISQLTIEQTTLDAAQAIFARISSSSLFNYLR